VTARVKPGSHGMTGPAVTVADCERVQTNWYRKRAQHAGGEIWTDGPLTWTDGPDGLNLMFPQEMTAAAVRRGTERGRDLGRPIVGAWLGLDVDPAPLAEAGFERGWSPRWMTAPLAEIAGPADRRVELQHDSADYQGEHAAYREQLALTRHEPAFTWYAAAYTHPRKLPGGPARFAGRAWSFLDTDNLAGIFDMAVWGPFRRRGLGTGLLRAVCAAAAGSGARHAVLNATADGKLLYSACGFTQIGEGVTWWLHLR
jgi:GNAT superfamily N-acetyltransferase